MSYLVWNIDVEAIRHICMDSAFFQSDWQFSETSDDLLERLESESESPDLRINCYDELVEAIGKSDSCKRLASMANSKLSAVYNGYTQKCIHKQDITPREIVDYMYDLHAFEQFF